MKQAPTQSCNADFFLENQQERLEMWVDLKKCELCEVARVIPELCGNGVKDKSEDHECNPERQRGALAWDRGPAPG